MPNIPEKVLRTGFSFLPKSLVFFTKRPIMWIGRFLVLALNTILSYVGATELFGMVSVLVRPLIWGRALLGAKDLYSEAGKLLNMLGSGGDQSIRLDVDESRLAIGVLLYKVIQVDGRVRDEEIFVYRGIIEKYLGVREDELISFEENVLSAFKDPVYDASMMKLLESLSLEQKRDILAFMQEISLSDREFHEFELNMVAKTSKILGLD